MRSRVIPSPAVLIAVVGGTVCLLVALIVGAPVTNVAWAALAWVGLLAFAAIADYRLTHRAWLQMAPQMSRLVPPSLAVGAGTGNRPLAVGVSTALFVVG